MNKIETYGPSEKVKEMWPKKIEEFAPFVKELFKLLHIDKEKETYALIAVDSKKNRRILVYTCAATMWSKKEAGMDAVAIVYLPYFEKYTMTEKDLKDPYKYSIKDEPLIKIEMQMHFFKLVVCL